MRKILHLILVLLPVCASAQITGIINDYTKVLNIDLACNKIEVKSAAAFSQGDTVLIIQMKGATIDQTNGSTYGNISSYNDAGNYELAQIYAIDGNFIYLKNKLIRSYTPAGSVQLVSVPQFTDIEISGVLTARPWDGETGGVLVFEASGTVTFGGNIDVSGKGFRGYKPNAIQNSSGPCNTSYYVATTTNDVTSAKGESISDSLPGKEFGRNPQANGGGGGNSNNTGGGGGSNYNTGGDGGSQSSGCFLGLAGNPGKGGTPLTYSNGVNKVFLGGAGGAGHQNNFNSSTSGPPATPGSTPGGNGGGIVIIKAAAFDGNGNSIYANGVSPASYSYGDGAGGGGGGGAVLLSVGTYASALTIQAKGGKGGNVYDETGRDLGPGGGGGGGVIWTSVATSANITASVSGGATGISTRNGNTGLASVCECSHGATAGANGGLLTGLVIPESTSLFSPACISLPVEVVSFQATAEKNRVYLSWVTAWERNNQYFTIERSYDLKTFETVGRVDAKGNTHEFTTYGFYDESPLEGTVYYRLSQTDTDGKRTDLGVRKVSFFRTKLIHKIYPVPFGQSFTLLLNPELVLESEVVIRVYNVVGELIFESSSMNASTVEVSLGAAAPGIYHLVVQSEGMMETAKVVKKGGD